MNFTRIEHSQTVVTGLQDDQMESPSFISCVASDTREFDYQMGNQPDKQSQKIDFEDGSRGNDTEEQHFQGKNPEQNYFKSNEPELQHFQSNDTEELNFQGKVPEQHYFLGNETEPRHFQGNDTSEQHFQGNDTEEHHFLDIEPELHFQGNDTEEHHFQDIKPELHFQDNEPELQLFQINDTEEQHYQGKGPEPQHFQGNDTEEQQQCNGPEDGNSQLESDSLEKICGGFGIRSGGGSGESSSEYLSVDLSMDMTSFVGVPLLEKHDADNDADVTDNEIICVDDVDDDIIGADDVDDDIIGADDSLGPPVAGKDLAETLQEFDFLEDDDECYSDACSQNSDIQDIEIEFDSSSEDEDPFGIRETIHDVEVEVENVIECGIKHSEKSSKLGKSDDEERICFTKIKRLCLEELKRFANGDEHRFSKNDSQDMSMTSFSELEDSYHVKSGIYDGNDSKISFSEELTSYEWDDSKNSPPEESENPLLDRLNEIQGLKDSRASSTQVTIKLTKTLSVDNLPALEIPLKEAELASERKIPRLKKSKRSPSLKLSTSLCRSITDLTKLGTLGVSERDPLFSPGQIRKMLSSTFSSTKNVPRRHVQSLYSPSDDVEVDHIIKAEGSPKGGKKSPLFERLTNWDGFRKSKKGGVGVDSKYQNNTISDPGRVKRRASLGAMTSAPLYEEQPHFNQLASKREFSHFLYPLIHIIVKMH